MATRRRMTYASAGVDTRKQKEAIKALTSSIRFRRTGRGAPVGGLTHFAGLLEFDQDTLLALCADGVGTKLEVASALGKWDTVGIDCVAMNANDCICVGAEPLAFVDYIATQKPDATVTAAIGRGLDKGARLANVTLAGGETAIMPELVRGWDLAGALVGWAHRDEVLDGSQLKHGDVIIGLASTGLHSNGFTLARRILRKAGLGYRRKAPGGHGTLGDVLIEPTAMYVRDIIGLRESVKVHGMANITGGGLRNMPRMGPHMRYRITDPMPVPRIFPFLQKLGNVSDAEMYRTFNMGMGFAVVVPPRDQGDALDALSHHKPKVVGVVEAGTGCAHEPLDLEFESKT